MLLLSPAHFRWYCSNMLEIQWEQKQHRLTHIETEGFHKWGYGWFSINDGFHKWWFIWGYDGFSINHPYWNPLKLHGKSQKEKWMIWYPRPWLRKPSANGSKPFPHLPGVVRQPQVFRRNDSTRHHRGLRAPLSKWVKKTARLMEYLLYYIWAIWDYMAYLHGLWTTY